MQGFTTAGILGMLGSPFLSMIVGFITSSKTPAGLKSVLLLVLAAVYGFVEEWATSPSFNFWSGLVKAVAAFMVAVNTHYGFSKPVGLADALQKTGPQLGAPPE